MNSLAVSRTDDHAVVRLTGEHEALTAGRLAVELEDLLERGYVVTVDLSEAAFVDSTVIGALLGAHRAAREVEQDLELLLGPETGWAVRRLLELTGLDSVFAIREA